MCVWHCFVLLTSSCNEIVHMYVDLDISRYKSGFAAQMTCQCGPNDSNRFKHKSMFCNTPDGTRTHNLSLRRATRYPLRHWCKFENILLSCHVYQQSSTDPTHASRRSTMTTNTSRHCRSVAHPLQHDQYITRLTTRPTSTQHSLTL